MNELKIFENKEFGSVRTLEIDGKPYFVANDVARALGYTNPSKATNDHCKNAIMRRGNDSLGRQAEFKVIPEGDIYRLIIKSQLPTAEKFEKWVFDEVLPSIRKHGVYAIDDVLNNPDMLITALQELKAERAERRRLESEKAVLESETLEMSREIEQMKPKVNYVDVILQSKSTVCVTQIAQDYGMSAMTFNKTLQSLGVQRKVAGQWILYKQYLTQGYVQSETVNVTRRDGTVLSVMNTKWSQKGRLFLYELLKRNNIYPLIEKAA